MNRSVLLVAIGSMLGGVARYLCALGLARSTTGAFPYGTFAVNIAGCLVIGLVYGFAARFDWFSSDLRLFLATGFCGGFTTFSAFAYENIQLLEGKDYLTFGAYSALSFILGLGAAYIGLALAEA
ncbi:MAG: fluoride efflux transporter CrcB [Pyrinomonadaceae bacterium]